MPSDEKQQDVQSSGNEGLTPNRVNESVSSNGALAENDGAAAAAKEEDDREKRLLQNLALEMVSRPFMANWAQIRDAEHRLFTANTKIVNVNSDCDTAAVAKVSKKRIKDVPETRE